MKAYSKAAKRRAKKDLPQLAEVPRKQPNGRKRRPTGHVAESRDDATALKARARQMGISEAKAGTMKSPMLECDAGRALYHEDDAQDLWSTFEACRSSYERYQRQRTGLSIYAKTAKIEMMPERFETSADDTIDDRTDDERHRDACNAWSRWLTRLEALSDDQASRIFAAIYGWGELCADGVPTAKGRGFVKAVRALHDGG